MNFGRLASVGASVTRLPCSSAVALRNRVLPGTFCRADRGIRRTSLAAPMAGIGSGPSRASPTPAELMQYGDMCEVTYDNWRAVKGAGLQQQLAEQDRAHCGLDQKIEEAKAKLNELQADSVPESDIVPMEIPDNLKFLANFILEFFFQILIRSDFSTRDGKPWHYISAAKAKDMKQNPGLPVWAADRAKRYSGYEDLWTYSGKRNTDAAPNPPTIRLTETAADEYTPHWAGYMAYRPPTDGEERGELLIAFRGTQLNSEWFSNLMSGMLLVDRVKWGEDQDGNELLVHRGFSQIYSADDGDTNGNTSKQRGVVKGVLRHMLETCKAFKGVFPRVTVTGHSLGSALATLCAVHVAQWLQDNNVFVNPRDYVTAYTYSAPRVGNKAFCDKVDEKVTLYRVFKAQDVVPRVPPNSDEDLDFLAAAFVKLDERAAIVFGIIKGLKEQGLLQLDWQHPGMTMSYDASQWPSAGPEAPECKPAQDWGIWDHHNLQALLYLVAVVGNEDRDPTSINKGTDILTKVKPAFWKPFDPNHHNGVKKRDGSEFPLYSPPGYENYHH